MVKLTSPCMSIDARGTLGNVLTFAKTGKVNYAKKHFSPANPRSNAQVGIRAMTKFLTQIWSSLTTAQKESFAQLAEQLQLSNYHAFLKHNSRRWADGFMPTVDMLDTDNPDIELDNIDVSLSGNVHSYTLNLLIIPPMPSCCAIYCDFDTDPAISKEFCKSVVGGFIETVSNYQLTGSFILEPTGTPHYKFRISSPNGTNETILATL